MGSRKFQNFNGVAIDLNNIDYFNKVNDNGRYYIRFDFWSGAYKYVGYNIEYNRDWDFNWLIRNL